MLQIAEVHKKEGSSNEIHSRSVLMYIYTMAAFGNFCPKVEILILDTKDKKQRK